MKETGFKVNFIVLILSITAILGVTLFFIFEELSEIDNHVDVKTNTDAAFAISIFAIAYFYINSVFNSILSSNYFIIKYIFPIIIVGVIVMIPYSYKLRKLSKIRKIVINFSRTDLEIANNVNASDNLLVTVNNNSKNDIYFDMQISCPSDIKAEIEGNNKFENYSKKTDIKVDAKKLVYIYVYFKYEGNNTGNSPATIEITCKDKDKHILLKKKEVITLSRIK